MQRGFDYLGLLHERRVLEGSDLRSGLWGEGWGAADCAAHVRGGEGERESGAKRQ